MKKRILSIFLWIIALALIALLVFSYIGTRGEASYSIRPAHTQVVLNEDGGEAFLNAEDVLEKLPFDPLDSTLNAIHTYKLESLLLTDVPYVKEVNAFVAPTTNTLNVHLTSRTPILRYLQGGRWYFLDTEGTPMTTRLGASAYVPVAVGGVTDETRDNLLYPLAQFLYKHKTWETFFGLIEVVSPRKLHLYPRVGDYVFEVYGVDNLEEDLSKIPIFYQKIVPQVGSNKYKLVKLSYKDQIVCKLR